MKGLITAACCCLGQSGWRDAWAAATAGGSGGAGGVAFGTRASRVDDERTPLAPAFPAPPAHAPPLKAL